MDRSEPSQPVPVGLPIILPPHPPEPAAPGFPVLATVAPIAGALVLWMVTGSAISLAFAALGPLVAVASVFDGRRQARRARRLGVAERNDRLEAVRAEITERHGAERMAAWRDSPSARQLVDRTGASDWRDAAPGPVVLGRGAVPSGVRVDGTPVDAVDRELLERAGRLDDAPVRAPVDGGIGIVGPLPLARASARAVLVQLAHRCRPGLVEVAVPEGEPWSWATALPHHRAGGDRLIRVVDDGQGGGGRERVADVAVGASDRVDSRVAVIAVAEAHAALPPGLGTILIVESHARAMFERRDAGFARSTIVPELLGASEASNSAVRMHRAAAREGVGGAAALPTRVDLDSLPQPHIASASRASLRVAVGLRHGGPLDIDLAADGPHAIVAGTTGSGKSEFLLAWIAALAASQSPRRVAFLLVDFKGGAAFAPVRDLPHVTGIVTDLDESEAERAVLSLRAELRHRESVLRSEGVRDIIELGDDADLARLVIVIDEFQAMVERFPELGAVIADIAARGRSLGVHLVLASQRPNGVVREQVTANCAIRVSLRVMQRADSIAVVGTDAAASIRPDAPGRAVIDTGDGAPVVFQSARVDERSLTRLRRMHADAAPARRPWVDPLPARLAPHELDRIVASVELDTGSLPIGLLDEPERQRHGIVAWSPAHDGHLLILGAPGSGRSTALAAVARAAASRQPTPALVALTGPSSRQWDTMQAMLARVSRPGLPALLLIDDLDARFRDWPDEHRHAALAALEVILREGRRRGVAVVATAGQAHRFGQGIRDSFARLLLLRHPTRSDLAHAGGSAALWREQDPPGSGQWLGHRVQVVDAPTVEAPPHTSIGALDLGDVGLCAVVSTSPKGDAAALAQAGLPTLSLDPVGDTVVRGALAERSPGDSVRRIVVGDADAWASNWSIAALMREEATIVVHGGPREYRALVADRALPPLLDDPTRQCWVIHPRGRPERAAWPPSQTTETVGRTRHLELNPNAMLPEINDSDMIA
jgi:DNA segregation ATPase FtsK/SpoIIIE, S-DNA-T family